MLSTKTKSDKIKKPKKKTILLIFIDADPDIQPRADGINQDVVQEYTTLIKDKVELPPLVVFKSGRSRRQSCRYLLAEGFHRLAAYKAAGHNEVVALVYEGSRSDAIRHAAGSNNQHGLRRTNADKRRAVEMLLKTFPKWSNRQIADAACVTHPFVANVKSGVVTVTTPDPQRHDADNHQDENQSPNEEVVTVTTSEAVSDSAPLAASDTVNSEQSEHLPRSPAANKPAPDAITNGVPVEVKDWLEEDREEFRLAIADLKSARDSFNKLLNRRGGAMLGRVTIGLNELFTRRPVKVTPQIVREQWVSDRLETLITAARRVRPVRICAGCRGREGGCVACRGSGFVPFDESLLKSDAQLPFDFGVPWEGGED